MAMAMAMVMAPVMQSLYDKPLWIQAFFDYHRTLRIPIVFPQFDSEATHNSHDYKLVSTR
jgi:hypothetical protein